MRSTSFIPALALFAFATSASAQVRGPVEGERRIVIPVAGDSLEAFDGRVTVPLVRSDPAAGTIDLRYVRFPATGADPGSPIVYLAGGPGGSGIDAFRGSRQSFYLSLREIADVIAFDQRGTGDSEPEDVLCEHERGLPLDRPGSPDGYLQVIRDEVQRCLGVFRDRGIDPAGFTTAENADDIDALRRKLGTPRLSLLGSSYGTHLALAVMRRHPDAVDRVVLAGVEGPDDTLKLPSNIERNLEDLATVARKDSLYATRLSDLVGSIDSLREALAESPREITLLHGALVVGSWDLQEYVASFIGPRGSLGLLPAAIYTLTRGDWTDFGRWVERRRDPGSTHAMALAMDCASYASPERLTRIGAESSDAVAGAAIDFPLPEICDVPNLPRLGADFRAPVDSDTPALFISGTLDGRTPLSNARAVAAGFSRSRELVVEGAGHGADLYMGSPAIAEAIRDFFRGRTPPERLALPGFELEPPHERSLVAEVLERLEREGYDATAAWYRTARADDPLGRAYDWSESELNALGYDLLGADRVDLAVQVFRLNVFGHPEAFNPWDSLGEGYMNAGETEKAIAAYEKSLELNPANANARRMLARLRDD